MSPPSTISLWHAICKGRQYLVKQILTKNPALMEYPGPNSYLPLANAIILGKLTVVDMLLTLGASVHKGNLTNKRTPLHVSLDKCN